MNLNRKGFRRPRKEALQRDGRRCRRCFTTEGLEVHHVKPLCDGGTHDLDNLLTLCIMCHREWDLVDGMVGFNDFLDLPPVRLVAAMLLGGSAMSARDIRTGWCLARAELGVAAGSTQPLLIREPRSTEHARGEKPSKENE